jgi:hypothetical protein
MASRTIYVNLSREAAARLASVKEEGVTARSLRNWLIRNFESSTFSQTTQRSLFATEIEVDEDVPLLIEALSRVTNRTPDDLIDAWIREPQPEDSEPSPNRNTVGFPADTRGRLIELLDLAETLFEETISDVEQRFGAYPQGNQAEASAAEIYRALRLLLKIGDEK